MAHGASASSIELSGDTKLLTAARKWNVDYALQNRAGQISAVLQGKQADAMTACFSEYSRKVLNKSKSRRIPIRDQLNGRRSSLPRSGPAPKSGVQEAAHDR